MGLKEIVLGIAGMSMPVDIAMAQSAAPSPSTLPSFSRLGREIIYASGITCRGSCSFIVEGEEAQCRIKSSVPPLDVRLAQQLLSRDKKEFILVPSAAVRLDKPLNLETTVSCVGRGWVGAEERLGYVLSPIGEVVVASLAPSAPSVPAAPPAPAGEPSSAASLLPETPLPELGATEYKSVVDKSTKKKLPPLAVELVPEVRGGRTAWLSITVRERIPRSLSEVVLYEDGQAKNSWNFTGRVFDGVFYDTYIATVDGPGIHRYVAEATIGNKKVRSRPSSIRFTGKVIDKMPSARIIVKSSLFDIKLATLPLVGHSLELQLVDAGDNAGFNSAELYEDGKPIWEWYDCPPKRVPWRSFIEPERVRVCRKGRMEPPDYKMITHTIDITKESPGEHTYQLMGIDFGGKMVVSAPVTVRYAGTTVGNSITTDDFKGWEVMPSLEQAIFRYSKEIERQRDLVARQAGSAGIYLFDNLMREYYQSPTQELMAKTVARIAATAPANLKNWYEHLTQESVRDTFDAYSRRETKTQEAVHRALLSTIDRFSSDEDSPYVEAVASCLTAFAEKAEAEAVANIFTALVPTIGNTGNTGNVTAIKYTAECLGKYAEVEAQIIVPDLRQVFNPDNLQPFFQVLHKWCRSSPIP